MGDTKDRSEMVIILDRETPAVTRSPELAAGESRGSSEDGVSSGGAQERAGLAGPAAGVDQGNAATELLEPFVRAIEVLLRGLGDALGEPGSAATIGMGSLVIELSNAGWGDDTVRVSRHRRRAEDRSPEERTRHTDRPVAALTRPPGTTPEPVPDAELPNPGGDGAIERTGDRWEQGVNAAREGDHAQALALFEEEAERCAEEGLHHRAAIAYRSASREAGWIGRSDHANKLLRLAGKHYLFVGESPDTSAQGVVQAFSTAAKCFLQAGNLPLASASITRALATSETLSAIA